MLPFGNALGHPSTPPHSGRREAAVAGVLVQNRPVPMKILGVTDRKGISGKPHQLMEYYGITAEHIVEAAEELLKRKNSILRY